MTHYKRDVWGDNGTVSSEASLRSIESATGMTPEQFYSLARDRGLLGPQIASSTLVAWLKVEYGLAHSQAMALCRRIESLHAPSEDELLLELFGDARSRWRPTFEALWQRMSRFGPDVRFEIGKSVVSFRRGRRKFAVAKINAVKFELGIVRRGIDTNDRFVDATGWQPDVTHRILLATHREVDEELVDWLRRAYDAS